MERELAGMHCGPSNHERYIDSWQGDYLEAHLISDVGKKREKNEDACVVYAPESPKLLQNRGVLFAVADGMGGASAGEHASHLALKVLVESYFEGNKPQTKVPIALRTALEVANVRIYEEASTSPELSGMGTTVSAMVILGNWAYIAQVGDSRIYHFRQGDGLQQITQDHSLVEEQVRCGVLTPDEARNHSLKNLITRAVGIRKNVDIDLFVNEIRKGDIIFICSDGMSNMVTDEKIEDLILHETPDIALKLLMNYALAAGGTDNITAVAVEVTGTPPKEPLQQSIEIPLLQPNGLIRKILGYFR